ncbi:MAG: glycine dehydrogenase (aminomethyl-transferring) [Alteromonadaceae bacterium]|nr:MAG: glycine dehydrogenase (aminomethyl-transferring) [Alteromonadaceae bacterium]
MQTPDTLLELTQASDFSRRHIGPSSEETEQMLGFLKLKTLDELIQKTIPTDIHSDIIKALPEAKSEFQALTELSQIAQKNKIYKNYIGLGYHDTHVPPVILRNVLENPGWYTAYTPYQPEIAQGRLEGLLNFQQMIIELTGMDMANASMLDEASAAAEAMAMAKRVARKNKSDNLFVDQDCHPQTIAVLKTRAEHFGWNIILGDPETDLPESDFFGLILQYPGSSGAVKDISHLIQKCAKNNAISIVAADIMSLVLLQPPGKMGADIVVGSSQRFGVPMGFGGPHAAYFAFRDKYKRSSPGRIIGVSRDKHGKPALRMAMQTREQHIRREKANSNICTSQVLLAVMSAFYAMYHGPKGLNTIAQRIHIFTKIAANTLQNYGFSIRHAHFFDSLIIETGDQQKDIYTRAINAQINIRLIDNSAIGISLNECTTQEDLLELITIFIGDAPAQDFETLFQKALSAEHIPSSMLRSEAPLQHPVFSQYHSETDMLRYLKRLESKDIALNHAMIPLGSCTMKLNATSEMIPVTWPQFAKIHPFAPLEQSKGYQTLFLQLENMLKICSGYDAVSLQPNAGSQGEYAGLIAIKKYFESKGDTNRDICLIPASAHGTNPASAQMVGMRVVVINCDSEGNVDLDDLNEKIRIHNRNIAVLMITYPSTHGVFEQKIKALCQAIHDVGGQVYIDGANMNALVGLAAPGEFGGDVSHFNLHKTFCIPHGGGGPGVGPIGVKSHLAPFLPSHPITSPPNTNIDNGTISAAPWGSASILPISWMYITMMGNNGMKRATQTAILNANYIAQRLQPDYPILYRGENGFVAHECLLDLRPLKDASGVTEEDIAKRLMDFGFHAPTMSFPVAGTLMIEPTESESKQQLDRFCDAMLQIRREISQIESGELPRDNNPLINSPHTLEDVLSDNWEHPYSKEQACRALPYLKEHKVWPTVNRIDNVFGDRNLICSCPSIESYLED